MKRDKIPSNSQNNMRSLSYRKPIVEQKTTSKIKQGFFNFSTNITYKVEGGFSKLKSFFKTDSDKNQHRIICINGKKFSNQREAKDYFSRLIWFSYRRMPGLSFQYHSDTGWGCLIRVGQMALASGLKTYLQHRSNLKISQQEKITNSIIIAFVESGGKYEKYSLKKIVQKAHIKFKLNYGQWFNTNQICQVLTSLHNKDPMKGSQNLVLVHFKDSLIYLQQIFIKINKKMCTCKKVRICCQVCNGVTYKQDPKQIQTMLSKTMTEGISKKYQSQKQLITKSHFHINKQIVEKKLLVFVGCRLGMQKINSISYKQLIELLGLQCSLGIVGGVPKRGYYFVGYDDNELIYLDPHLVQDEITLSNIHLKLKQFQCEQFRRAKRQQIDPSMSFVFYIDSLKTLNKLYMKIQQMKQNYENPIISIDWINQYNKGRSSNIEVLQENGQNQLENSFLQEL